MRADALLDLWRRSAFEWGKTDCIMATCNHILAETGIDPAAPWRGTYSDEAGARAIYDTFGGVRRLFRYGMARAGFGLAERVAPGLPVVCDVAGLEVAGVYLGNRVAFMAKGRGVVEMRAKVLDVWAI